MIEECATGMDVTYGSCYFVLYFVLNFSSAAIPGYIARPCAENLIDMGCMLPTLINMKA